MRPTFVSLLTVTVAVVTMIAALGCGGSDGLERVAVSGSVTIDGEPVPNGVVRFAPAAGTEGPMASTMITDGRYRIPSDAGPVAGSYEAQVHAYQDPYAPKSTKTKTESEPVIMEKFGPAPTAAEGDDEDEDNDEEEPADPKEAKRTFTVTIPALSSFEQDFAL